MHIKIIEDRSTCNNWRSLFPLRVQVLRRVICKNLKEISSDTCADATNHSTVYALLNTSYTVSMERDGKRVLLKEKDPCTTRVFIM